MPRSRKWLITINNPIEHDFDHARIKAAVLDLPSVVYWCMCDEQGDECETLHTHVYLVASAGLTHTQIDARFPSFHRDIARGKSSENRAYVLLALPGVSSRKRMFPALASLLPLFLLVWL